MDMTNVTILCGDYEQVLESIIHSIPASTPIAIMEHMTKLTPVDEAHKHSMTCDMKVEDIALLDKSDRDPLWIIGIDMTYEEALKMLESRDKDTKYILCMKNFDADKVKVFIGI